MKNFKKFICLICTLVLIIVMCPITSLAEETNTVTASTSSSIKQGNSGTCYVYIDSTKNIAALDVTVHFDPEKVKINSLYNSINATIYDNIKNTDNIQFSYILDGVGSASKTRLFYFNYQVLADAEIGDTYFDITIGEAYDNSLNDIAISGSRCKFTVTETVTTKSCSVYSSSSINTSVEKEFSLSYRFSTYQIASGSAEINYDPELFSVVSVTNGGFLSNKIADVNTELKGSVYISFVGTTYNTQSDFVTVKFKTLKNVSEISKINFKTTELCDKDLNPISCNGYTTTANIVFDDEYIGDAPKMYVISEYNEKTNKVTAKIMLEENSNLGAGDFVLKFNPEILTLSSYEKGFNPNFFNINEKLSNEGVFKFSIISLSDITTAETVLTLDFDVNLADKEQTTTLEISGSMIADSLTNSILLNFIDSEVLLPSAYETGDLNADDCVDICDLVILKEILLGATQTEGASPDVNNDGSINSQDLVFLKKYLFANF